MNPNRGCVNGQINPNEILKLSEPVEQVYSNIVDALLINMGKHFNSGYSLSTEQWEIRKLAELGQLNKESIEIIASLTGQNKELITAALENAVYMATKDIEPELKKPCKRRYTKRCRG
ncbi:MAG: phage minor capsid protein [[Clostridium] leptum]